jgi:hypothetical protein
MAAMTEWFLCPLCGHHRPISGWDPSGYDDEIKIRDVQGLGKGHGSTVASEWNASVDSSGLDLTAMARRCLKIIAICIDECGVDVDELLADVPENLAEAIRNSSGDPFSSIFF